MNNHVAEHRGGTDRAPFDPSRTRRTHEVPFIAGGSHFTWKKQGFLPRLSPQNEAHATSMQPLQCVLQHQVANPHLWQHKATTIMQPLHCFLQPESQETHRITHTWTTTRCRTQRRNRSRSVRPQPHPLHTHEVPFIAGGSHLSRKNTRFPAAAFPQNEAHATSMQPSQCVLQHQVPNLHLSTHIATQNDNNHAALALRSATRESRKA